MPKEPKKFINPLLRPSSTTEQNERIEEKPSRKVAAAKSPSLSTEQSAGTNASTSEQNAALQEERIVEQAVMPQARSGRRSSSALAVGEREAKVATPISSAAETSLVSQTAAETYTYTSPIENTLPEAPLSPPVEDVSKPQSQIQLTVPANIQETPAQSLPLYRSQTEAQNYVERLPQLPGSSYVSGPLAYPSAEESAHTAPLSSALPREQHTGDLLDSTEFSAMGAVRRRRGAQTFEKTHERITLWIDKRLKQAFDELAYEHELPKTALLNEAIADLLRKYRAH